jgi:hypothetical protein
MKNPAKSLRGGEKRQCLATRTSRSERSDGETEGTLSRFSLVPGGLFV